jgi:hypothetical protein
LRCKDFAETPFAVGAIAVKALDLVAELAGEQAVDRL